MSERSGGDLALSLSLRESKSGFFDRPRVFAMLADASYKVLSRAGAYVREVMRRLTSVKTGKSKPGESPHSHPHTSGLLRGGFRDSILFSYDPGSHTVVAGPVLLGREPVPAVLEYGGTVTRSDGRASYIAPRPYVSRAWSIVEPRLPKFWADAMRGR